MALTCTCLSVVAITDAMVPEAQNALGLILLGALTSLLAMAVSADFPHPSFVHMTLAYVAPSCFHHV